MIGGGMDFAGFLSENRAGLAVALAVLLLGSIAYWSYGYDRETFVLMKGSAPKLFMVFHPDEGFAPALAEGSLAQFRVSHQNGTKVCPIMIGAGEAEMMRKEGLFSKAGDRISGFFGNEVVVSGVLAKAGGQLDMFHFVSKDCVYS
jgi:hypothetical protein